MSKPNLSHRANARLPTEMGEFEVHAFVDLDNGAEHLALKLGRIDEVDSVLCRVHSACVTGDALFSRRCDCGPQLQLALRRIAEEGSGLLLYLAQEGRGIGLGNKIHAYQVQDAGSDTVEANESLGFAPDLRDYRVCGPMFSHFGACRLRLMTNNPDKVRKLEEQGLEIAERLSHVAGENESNRGYLRVKRDKLGHWI